jgi:hypothetical protein
MSDPSEVRAEVQKMRDRAEVCNALVGGTEAMREAGRKYLPQAPLEEDEDWAARMALSVLYSAYKDAVDIMVGKPLGVAINRDGLAPVIKEAMENVDLTGQNLETFAREWFRQSLIDGIGWVLVDYPQVPEGATLKDERELNARPYWVHIPLSKVCGWRTEIVGGQHRLTQFRWRETYEEPDGDFGVKTKERIKVWEPGELKVYVNNGPAWELDHNQSCPVSMKEIPIVCFAPGKKGFFTAEPPLSELAWLNVQHWQSSSDQRNILHVARVPVMTADKVVLDKDGKPIKVSPNKMIVGFEGLRYVEHSGRAIEAGRQDILDLQEQMAVVAGTTLTREAGPDTSATKSALEAKEGSSKLLQWTNTFEDCLNMAQWFMCDWLGLTRSTRNNGLTINKDFDKLKDFQTFTGVLQSRIAREISRDTFIQYAMRFGILPDSRSVQEEMALIDSEPPQSMSEGF